MTISGMIDMVDGLVPNGIDREVKVGWLNDCDATIHRDIFLTHEGTDKVTFSGYSADTDPETHLLLDSPHQGVYRWYLETLIHGANQEMTRYNNAATQYNAAYLAMADDFNRRYMPKGRKNPKYW